MRKKMTVLVDGVPEERFVAYTEQHGRMMLPQDVPETRSGETVVRTVTGAVYLVKGAL